MIASDRVPPIINIAIEIVGAITIVFFFLILFYRSFKKSCPRKTFQARNRPSFASATTLVAASANRFHLPFISGLAKIFILSPFRQVQNYPETCEVGLLLGAL